MTAEAPTRASAGLHPSIVLAAYVEPLVRGRRVAILGDATIGLADELSQRGVRLLHVYDPDPARVAEALARVAPVTLGGTPKPPSRPHQVSYALLAGDLGVRDGAFDAVVVPDLSLFDDPADAIRRARRLVSSAGVAVFVAPNTSSALTAGRRLLSGGPPRPRSAPGYYELFDLVSLQFAKVRMAGQAPFVGYTVADFSPRGEPEVSVDTSLLATSEEPEHFIAVAGDRPVSIDPYSVIGLPWHDVAESMAAVEVSPTARTGEKVALADAEARVASLEAELTRTREREAALAREVDERAPVAAALSARVAEMEREMLAREDRFREIEARAGDNHVRAEPLGNQIRDMDEELRRQRDRATRLSKQLDDEKKLRTKFELELGMVRGRPEIAGGKDRIDSLTAELEAARARLAEMEMEMAQTRRRLSAPPLPPPPPPPDPKVLHRLEELEQAVNAALREASEAASQRDLALDRARKAEARAERAAAAEAELAAGQRERADLSDRLAEIERASIEAGRQAEPMRERVVEGERRLAEAERLAAEREGHIAELSAHVEALAAQLAAAQKRAHEEPEEPEEVSAHPGGRPGAPSDELDAAAIEVDTLEAALRERGHRVAQLERDVREAERVGKELLDELLARHAWNGNGAASEDLRGRLDVLAANAARSEADLQAAAWRIAQLERELTEARREAREPSAVQVELEQALAAARDEVASLRRALGGAS